MRNVARLGLLIPFLTGIGGVIAWMDPSPFLDAVFIGNPSMKFNTALILVLLTAVGFSLFEERFNSQYFVPLLLFIGCFSLLTLSQDILDTNFGIDEILIKDHIQEPGEVKYPGRMSPMTACCFVAISMGLIFLVLGRGKPQPIAQISFHLTSLLAFVALWGYLLNVPPFYKIVHFNSIALPTSIAFIILSGSLAFLQPQIGLPGLLFGKYIGGEMARKLLPPIVLITTLLAAIIITFVNEQIFPPQYSIALFATLSIIIAIFLIAATASKLNGVDRRRGEYERKLVELNETLERSVAIRTEELEHRNEQLRILTGQVQYKNDRLNKYIHIISHNLRSHALNFSLLLRFIDAEKNPELRQEFFRHLHEVSKNLTETLEGLVKSVRADEGFEMKFEPIEFQKVFTRVEAILRASIQETGAMVRVDFKDAPTVNYNSVYLESIFINLLTNALKYHSPDRPLEIAIRTGKERGFTVLSIADNGLGIDLQKHGHEIFGLNKVFHDHPEARGVGLFITKAQIESLGGSIEVESVPDEWTVFKVWIRSQSEYLAFAGLLATVWTSLL